MITCKDWYSFFAAAALLACSRLAGAIETLVYSIEPQIFEPGYHAVLVVRLPKSEAIKRIAASTSLSATIDDDLLIKKKDIQLIDKSFHEEGDAFVWKYEFTAYKIGRLQLPPLEVQFGPFSLSTEAKWVEVSTTRMAGDEELRPEFGPIKPPFPWRFWAKWIAISILGGGIVAILIAFLPRRKLTPKPVPIQTSIPEEDPLTWLRRRLRTLQEQLHQSEEHPEWVDELTEVLRRYFEKLTQYPARSWTTQEFKCHFKEDEKAQAISLVLERCDVFKFQPGKQRGARQLTAECVNEAEKWLL